LQIYSTITDIKPDKIIYRHSFTSGKQNIHVDLWTCIFKGQ